MIVISDTSPLNYLILIGLDDLLPKLFGQVIAPNAVLNEMQNIAAPDQVRMWAANPPSWLKIQSPLNAVQIEHLGPGESEAILLARELKADLILIDERDGTAAAKKLGLRITGTLGVIDIAAKAGLITFADAIALLEKTTFRAPVKLVQELLRRHSQ